MPPWSIQLGSRPHGSNRNRVTPSGGRHWDWTVAGDGERSTRGRASTFKSWRKRESGQVDSTQGGGYLWRERTLFPQNEGKWVQGQTNTEMELKEEDRAHAHSP